MLDNPRSRVVVIHRLLATAYARDRLAQAHSEILQDALSFGPRELRRAARPASGRGPGVVARGNRSADPTSHGRRARRDLRRARSGAHAGAREPDRAAVGEPPHAGGGLGLDPTQPRPCLRATTDAARA